MPTFDVVIRNPEGREVDVSTLTDEQRETLMSDIEEQLYQQGMDDFALKYTEDRTGPASAGGVAVFTLKTDQPADVTLNPLEDFAGLFNGVTHTATIQPRPSGGKRRRKTRKGRKGKAKKTRKATLRFSY